MCNEYGGKYAEDMGRRPIIGVMGAGESARQEDVEMAFQLGELIAKEGWILLSGGRKQGVMDAVNKGAKKANGLTIGILPTKERNMISDAVHIPVITDMGSARNNINILSSDVVIACGYGGAGTASEIALAIKSKKSVVLLNPSKQCAEFFLEIGEGFISVTHGTEEAILSVKKLLTSVLQSS